LKTGGDRLLQLLKENQVAAVDMGHTHYNELTNDGQIIFAVRSWSAAGIVACRCRVGDGEWVPMKSTADPTRWKLNCTAPGNPFSLTVEAEDREGGFDVESIRVAAPDFCAPKRIANGSDVDSVGAWPEKHIFGTQLGPNRNGKHW
jgi:3',5'-cyclic-AMP phosphodiesterase